MTNKHKDIIEDIRSNIEGQTISVGGERVEWLINLFEELQQQERERILEWAKERMSQMDKNTEERIKEDEDGREFYTAIQSGCNTVLTDLIKFIKGE